LIAKRGRGRPTTFNSRIATTIAILAEEGKTDEEIAKRIGVNVHTLKNWKGEYADLVTALKDARSVADGLVEATLFQRACGYSAPAVKVFYDSKLGQVIEHNYIEHYPPDTVAAIFWLKNRQPKKWRDAHRLEVGGQEKTIPIAYVPKSLRGNATEVVVDKPVEAIKDVKAVADTIDANTDETETEVSNDTP
jgi:hypothetical protein